MMEKFDRHIKRKVDIGIDIYFFSSYQLLLFKLHLAHKIFIILIRVYFEFVLGHIIMLEELMDFRVAWCTSTKVAAVGLYLKVI